MDFRILGSLEVLSEGPRRVRFTEMEYAVPRECGPEAVRRTVEWIRSNRYPVFFPIEMRVSAGDDALLSPAHGRDTAYIAVHVPARTDPGSWFAALESMAAGTPTVAAVIPSATAQLAQLRELIFAPSIEGVSMAFLAMNVANQCLCVTWALLAHEQSVTIASLCIGSLMTASLVSATLRRSGVVRARSGLRSSKSGVTPGHMAVTSNPPAERSTELHSPSNPSERS